MKSISNTIAKLILCLFILSVNMHAEEVIIDSQMSFQEAIKGTKAPKEIVDNLVLIDVKYYSTDNKLHQGQLLIAKSVREDVEAIFQIILAEKFPVEKCIPIVKYNWSDNASMEDNNSSSFCYRKVAGSKNLSRHAMGMAVDINPRFNPVVHTNRLSPKNGKYDTKRPGTITANSSITKEFIKRGWKWGGTFRKYKDYHHFHKLK